MNNKKIIKFPTPKVQLNEKETAEYDRLEEKLEEANTFREIWHLKREVKEFLKKVYKSRGKR